MSRWVLRPPVESWGELFLGSMNKVARRKTSKYTTISNVFLRDKNLSLKAKGFLTVVMALPDDWDFSIKGICSILKEGKTAIYGVIQELKENRYCKTTPSRDEKGLILGLDYTFYEESYEEEQNKEEPQQDNPHSENRDMDNMPQLNTKGDKENNRIIDLHNKEEKDKSIPKKKTKFNVRDDLSYVDAPYVAIWQEWLDYKTEIKKQYKTQRGAKSQYQTLIKYANNNPILANAIVKISIEHSWDGLFPLSDKQTDFFLSQKSPYAIEEKGYEYPTNATQTSNIPNGWTQEQYDMYIRNGYTIADDGLLLKDGMFYK